MILLCAALFSSVLPAQELVDESALPTLRTPREAMPRHGTAAFRVSIPAGPPSVSTRLAFVQDFDGASIVELTLRGGYAWRSFGLAVEVAGTAGVSDQWAGAGLGNTVIDARGLFGGAVTHAMGLRTILPTGDRGGGHGPVGWWGTVPDATVPMTSVSMVYEGASPRFVWHVRIGLRWSPWGFQSTDQRIDAGVGLGMLQPLTERWKLVLEGEVMNSESPIHVRGLGRLDLGHGWEADLGLAVPVVAFVRDPTLQVVGRVERSW
ncbi:MAG: hypothetical protein V4850_13535 [Myxococcota bacterium]